MEVDLNEVAVFIKVVQTGSFSQAAKQLGMPNSTVSFKVSSLEKRLAMTLIQRTTRKLNITPAGQAYFKRCVQGLAEIQAAEKEMASIQGEPQGLLRMTAPIELGSSVLPDLISDYTKKYPKVSVELILAGRHIDLLAENVDLAIRAGDLKDSSLIAKKIGSVYFAPLASPKYLKAKGTPTHPRELKQHQCLQFTLLGQNEWKLVGPKGSLNIALTPKVAVDDLAMLKLLTLKADGIALLPTHLCYGDVQSGKLVRILPEWRTALTPVHFVYPAQKYVSPKLSSFIEMATESLKKNFQIFEI
jgi:DNA-binding transcriptional LysR family regulator